MTARPEPAIPPAPASSALAPAAAVSPGERAEAQARLEVLAPGYLERVRCKAAALSVPTTPAGRAEGAVAMVVATARINADVPDASRRRSMRLVKRGVGILTRFYFLHLTEQMTELGESTSWMGQALCRYVESLEAEVSDLRARVARLEQDRTRP